MCAAEIQRHSGEFIRFVTEGETFNTTQKGEKIQIIGLHNGFCAYHPDTGIGIWHTAEALKASAIPKVLHEAVVEDNLVADDGIAIPIL